MRGAKPESHKNEAEAFWLDLERKRIVGNHWFLRMDKLTVLQLKANLKKLGLPVSGSKTVLINRLKQHQQTTPSLSRESSDLNNNNDVSVEVPKVTVESLRNELRERGASLHGRKTELMERLAAYEAKNNFRLELTLEQVKPDFFVPADTEFKEINSSSALPNLTKLHINLYVGKFMKKTDMAEEMYRNQFLEFVRYCQAGKDHLFKGLVHAQMYKTTTSNVYVKLSCDGNVICCHCDCVAGAGGSAHCKHVCVVLFGIENMVREGTIIIRDACTDKLQTFHRPKKRYQGSPLKSVTLSHSTTSHFDLRPLKFSSIEIQKRVHNLLAPAVSNMPLKQLLPPANPYAVEWDHSYSVLPF